MFNLGVECCICNFQVMAQQLQDKQFYAQQQVAAQQRANANFSSSLDTVTNGGPNANGQAVGNGTISQADQTQLMLHYQQFEAASAVDSMFVYNWQ